MARRGPDEGSTHAAVPPRVLTCIMRRGSGRAKKHRLSQNLNNERNNLEAMSLRRRHFPRSMHEGLPLISPTRKSAQSPLPGRR